MELMKLLAGRREDVRPESGDWLIVDIGMRMDGGERSIGVWCSCEECSEKLSTKNFKELIELGLKKVSTAGEDLNLVIEAPLSVARKGWFPARRKFEERFVEKNGDRKREMRYWYHRGGAATMVAAQIFLRELWEAGPLWRRVRLFEGFASFKNPDKKGRQWWCTVPGVRHPNNEHESDVLKLKRAIGDCRYRKVLEPWEWLEPGAHVESPFPFCKKSLTPAVIIVDPD